MNNLKEELQDKCAETQLRLGLNDVQWKKQFGNKQGLYGFVSALFESYVKACKPEARIECDEPGCEAKAYNEGVDAYESNLVKELKG